MDRLIGQEKQLSQVKQWLDSNQFPASLLLSGALGSGKKMLAKAIASGLMCLEDEFIENCLCNACRRVREGIHPDVVMVCADEEASSVKIADIHSMNERANLKALEGDRKVFIIVGAERMTEEAMNAFLKALEEPPVGTYFIMLTQQPFRIRETLLSRCFQLRMSPIPLEELKQAICNRIKLKEKEALTLAKCSRGVMGKAFELANQDLRQMRAFFLKDVLTQPMVALETFVGKKRYEIMEALDFFVLLIRDLLVWNETRDECLLYAEDLEPGLRMQSEAMSVTQLLKMSDYFTETRNAIEENANPKIALLYLATKIKESLQGVAV